MKKRTLLLGVLLLGSFLLPSISFAQNYPEPKGHVNDYASVIDAQTESSLEAQLNQYEEQTTNEVVVLTVESLEGITVEEYAVGIFEKWGIGKENEDNGILFLVARDDRKMRIEVGYGFEGDLTDGESKRILENTVKPFLANDNFSEGIYEGTQKIIDTVSGDVVSKDTESKDSSRDGLFSNLISGFFNIFGGVFQFAIFALVMYAISKRNRGGKGGPPIFFGGSGGSFGGGFGGGSSGGFGGFGGGGSGGGGSSSDF